MQQKRAALRCPSDQQDDGTIVCTITGICIRMCSYGLEYELASRQGGVHVVSSSGDSREQQKQKQKRPMVKNDADTKKPMTTCGVGALDGIFRVKYAAMKGEFHESNLSFLIRRLLCMVVQVFLSRCPLMFRVCTQPPLIG